MPRFICKWSSFLILSPSKCYGRIRNLINLIVQRFIKQRSAIDRDDRFLEKFDEENIDEDRGEVKRVGKMYDEHFPDLQLDRLVVVRDADFHDHGVGRIRDGVGDDVDDVKNDKSEKRDQHP